MDGGLYKLSKLINRYFFLVRRIIKVNQVYAAYEAAIALVFIMILILALGDYLGAEEALLLGLELTGHTFIPLVCWSVREPGQCFSSQEEVLCQEREEIDLLDKHFFLK